MTPRQPVEIAPVANGYILFPSSDDSTLTYYADIYVFRSLYDLTAFLEEHFGAGAPLDESADRSYTRASAKVDPPRGDRDES